MIHKTYSRRDVLGGLAAGTALLPLLEADGLSAVGYPRRLLIVMLTQGVIQDKFWPVPSGGGTDLSTATFPVTTASLEPYKSDLIFIRGVKPKNYTDKPGDLGGSHYSYNCLFTGTRGKHIVVPYHQHVPVATSMSIDQAIADDIAKKEKLPLRSLHLGLLKLGGSWTQVCFHRGENAPILPQCDPKKVFDLFMGPGVAGGIATLERVRAERRSVLDIVGKDLERFAGRLGGEDKLKVNAHLQSVRDFETQTANAKSVNCSAPTISAADPYLGTNYPQTFNSMSDLVVAAFKCNMTRVATIQTANYNAGEPGCSIFPSWTPKSDGKYTDYHGPAHDPGPAGARKVPIDTWFQQQFAGLIRRFKAVPEPGSPDGTMLGNSAILFANHMGDGESHSSTDLPWIIAGSCGGYFKTGRVIRDSGSIAGMSAGTTTTNRVMTGLANAMGLPVTTFGDPVYGTGALPALTR